MSALLSPVPVPDGQGGYSTSIAGTTLRLRPGTDAWTYTRDGLVGSLRLPGRAPDGLRLVGRLGPGEAVLRLDPPLLLLPDETRELWVSWPLEVGVQLLASDGSRTEIDSFRPGFRRTMFGAVDTGRVLPAHTSALLDGPDADGVGLAALHLRATNRTLAVVQLRRAPVEERALTMWLREDRLATGDVAVIVRAEGSAEAHTEPGVCPAGWTTLGEGSRANSAALAWLIDATRRSVEYPI